jgi:hypothetical protein
MITKINFADFKSEISFQPAAVDAFLKTKKKSSLKNFCFQKNQPLPG